VEPGLRGDDLPLDTGQDLLALGQGQAQGGQVGEVVGPGDPHDVGAVFLALSSDAHQLHDPGHAVSASPENGLEGTLSDSHPQSCGSPVVHVRVEAARANHAAHPRRNAANLPADQRQHGISHAL
jgi:hypothetical protein